jgi:hypothetical protein
MPRKSKITAVPVEQPDAPAAEGEPNTEAQEMTEVMNDIKALEPEAEPIAEPAAEPIAEPVAEPIAEPVAEPKPKPKRASRAKAKPTPEPNVEVKEQTIDDTTVEVEMPSEENKEVKVNEKVSCPDCGKQMSAKTLKYSHGPNCLVKKKEAQEEKTERAKPSINDEMIEELVQSRMNNVRKERLAKREQALEKLVAGALPS